MLIKVFIAGLVLASTGAFAADGGGWPMWRADAARSGAVSEGVPKDLHLQWVREYAPPTDAWLNDATLQFAPTYHPVAAEGKVFVPSMVNDCVQALDAETGEVVWTAYAGGPVRFAPVYWQGKIYYASDDGKLYCVEAKTGKSLWVFNGAPRERLILGNDRLISTWPVRGGPVLKDGRIYFANGVWPFMGVFVYCLEADRGDVVWVNDGTLEDGASRDQRVMHRPYEACPGGYLTIADDKLLLPAGRVWPSCYDLKTGKRVLYTYRLPIGALKAPSSSTGIAAGGGYWFVACRYAKYWSSVFDTRGGGELVSHVSGFPAVEGGMVYARRGGELNAYDFAGKTFEKVRHPGEFSVEGGEVADPFPAAWTTQGAKALTDPVKIGSCLYFGAMGTGGKKGGGGGGVLSAVSIPPAGGKPESVWQTPLEGGGAVVLSAGGKLFVSTSTGKIMCFGAKAGEPRRWPLVVNPLPSSDAKAAVALKAVGEASGYVLVLGVESGQWIEALLKGTKRRIIVLDPDAAKVDAFRRKMHAAGVYGSRVAAVVGDIGAAGMPAYFAETIVMDPSVLPAGTGGLATMRAVYRCLRPYGGRLCMASDGAGLMKLETACNFSRLEGATLVREGDYSVVTRGELPLPTGHWGNAYGGDAGKTLTVQDALIKPPLGVQWFGGEASGDIFGRLGLSVICSYEGRVFTFNAKQIFAVDAYTGRMMWSVPGVGYARDDKKQGFAFFTPVVDGKGLYVANDKTIVEFVPATGKEYRKISIKAEWGLGLNGDMILQNDYLLLHSPSAVVCLSRKDGKALWIRKAADKKALSRMAVGGGNVYFAEGVGKKTADGPAVSGELESVSLVDGRTAWRVPLAGFPSGVIYPAKGGVILATWDSGLVDVRAEKGGQRVWTGNPAIRGGWWNPAMPIVWNDKMVFSGGQIVDIATGKAATAEHPLTGLPVPWTLPYKGFGCSMPNVVGDLLFSRGLDAVYYDLANGGVMGRLDGSRLACGWSVIPGSGVLAVMNGQQFDMCRCRNPIASPMGLVHDPGAELWTISRFDVPKQERIKRVGINLGAPGNRRAADGTLWMDYPVVAFAPWKGEKTPADLSGLVSGDPHLRVEVAPAGVEWFRHQALRIKGDGLDWVAASGGKGIRTLKVSMPSPATGSYTVRLVFAEPDMIKAGERVFDVAIQGKRVIEKLDIVAEAGGGMTVLIREVRGVKVGDVLVVELTPVKGVPVLCGVELVAE